MFEAPGDWRLAPRAPAPLLRLHIRCALRPVPPEGDAPATTPLRRRIENPRARGERDPATLHRESRHVRRRARRNDASSIALRFPSLRVGGRARSRGRDVRTRSILSVDSRLQSRDALDLHRGAPRRRFASRGVDGEFVARQTQPQPYRPANRVGVHFRSPTRDFDDALLHELHGDRSRGVHQRAPSLGTPAAHRARGLAGSHGLAAAACTKHGQDDVAEALGVVRRKGETTTRTLVESSREGQRGAACGMRGRGRRTSRSRSVARTCATGVFPMRG